MITSPWLKTGTSNSQKTKRKQTKEGGMVRDLSNKSDKKEGGMVRDLSTKQGVWCVTSPIQSIETARHERNHQDCSRKNIKRDKRKRDGKSMAHDVIHQAHGGMVRDLPNTKQTHRRMRCVSGLTTHIRSTRCDKQSHCFSWFAGKTSL